MKVLMVQAVPTAMVIALAAMQAQAAVQKPVTAQSSMEEVAHAIHALKDRWASWPIDADKAKAFSLATQDGKKWDFGSAQAYQLADTPYGDMVVTRVRAPGHEDYCFAMIVFNGSRTAWAIRAEDGSVIVPEKFTFEFVGDASTGRVDSLTFMYTLPDGTTGERTFVNQMPPPKRKESGRSQQEPV